MLGQEYAVGDVLRLCVLKVHWGDFDRANVVLRDMHRAPVVFDATQRNADFVTAEEEWCRRSSYIVSLIAIAASKAGSIIVGVAKKGQTETLADALRSPGRARHVSKPRGACIAACVTCLVLRTRGPVRWSITCAPGV